MFGWWLSGQFVCCERVVEGMCKPVDEMEKLMLLSGRAVA